MTDFAKIFIMIGAIFMLIGIALLFLGKIPGMGKLPGDILIKRDSFTFYFPLTTSILISIIFSIFLYLWKK